MSKDLVAKKSSCNGSTLDALRLIDNAPGFEGRKREMAGFDPASLTSFCPLQSLINFRLAHCLQIV